MGIGDFWLQSNNGKKISLESLQELKKSDLQNNSALIRIFNIFDTQNADGTKGADGVLNKEELTSLFNTMSSAAKLKGNASIFEADEAEDYINTTQTSEGQTLKQLGVKASDLFNFISALVQKNENNTTQVQSGVEALQQSYTPEEIEDLSIQTVTDDVRKARQIFNSQNENQGVVSDFVNGTKETFDTEFASSRVNRYLMREELCADLLAKSKSEEGLSEKEYLEAKINLAVSILPKLENSSLKSSIIKNILSLGLYEGFGNKTKAEQERIAEEMEMELLKDALRKLKPEDLTLFIQRVTAMPDAEFTEKAGQVVENMINQSLQEKIRDNQKPMADTNQVFIKHQPIPGSIEYIEQHNDAYRKMTFEETFEAERGVRYNQENIMDYAEKDAKMQFLLGMHNKREQIYNILHDATVTVDGNNKLGAPDTRAIKPCEEQLESAIIQALRNLYGDDIEKIQEGLNKLGISNLKIIQNGNNNDLLHPMKLVYNYESDNPNPLIKKMDLGGYDLVNIANKLQNYVDTNYQNALGGKTLEEYGQEVNSAYQMAYGARNAQHMAEAFAESQQEGVQTVKTVVQTGGMVVMIAGQLVPVGGQIAAAMTMGGLATSTFGSVGVSALENFTKAGGATEEDKKEMLKELVEAVALVGSGGAIGKTSEAAFRALVINKCPKLLAFASEVGIDATMSLAADYAITGQIDLSGEGIAQLQSILVGILHVKGNFSSYLNTHAGNVTTKPTDVTQKPRIDDLPYYSKVSNQRQIKKTYEDIKKIEKTIKHSEIPEQHSKLWNNCKQKIENFMNELSLSLENLNMQLLSKKYESIKNDLKRLVNNVGPETREKLTKMFAGLEHQFFNAMSFSGAGLQYVSSPLFRNKSTRELVIKTAKYRFTHDIDIETVMAVASRKKASNWEKNPVMTQLCKDLKTDAPLTLYRVDDLFPFIMTPTPDNMNSIGNLMYEAMKSGDTESVLKLLNSGECSIKYDNYMGTSVTKTTNKITERDLNYKAQVKWEINAPAGTEGAYLESLMLSPWSHQGEFLVQAGSLLKITNATYSNGTWHLKADLVQEKTNNS